MPPDGSPRPGTARAHPRAPASDARLRSRSPEFGRGTTVGTPGSPCGRAPPARHAVDSQRRRSRPSRFFPPRRLPAECRHTRESRPTGGRGVGGAQVALPEPPGGPAGFSWRSIGGPPGGAPSSGARWSAGVSSRNGVSGLGFALLTGQMLVNAGRSRRRPRRKLGPTSATAVATLFKTQRAGEEQAEERGCVRLRVAWSTSSRLEGRQEGRHEGASRVPVKSGPGLTSPRLVALLASPSAHRPTYHAASEACPLPQAARLGAGGRRGGRRSRGRSLRGFGSGRFWVAASDRF